YTIEETRGFLKYLPMRVKKTVSVFMHRSNTTRTITPCTTIYNIRIVIYFTFTFASKLQVFCCKNREAIYSCLDKIQFMEQTKTATKGEIPPKTWTVFLITIVSSG